MKKQQPGLYTMQSIEEITKIIKTTFKSSGTPVFRTKVITLYLKTGAKLPNQ